VLAPGVSAGEADGRHGRFRSRTDKPDSLHLREGGNNDLGEFGLGRRGSAEARAVAGCNAKRFEHNWGSMSENLRAPGADIVDVLVAVSIPEVRTQAADNERRVAADRAKSPNR